MKRATKRKVVAVSAVLLLPFSSATEALASNGTGGSGEYCFGGLNGAFFGQDFNALSNYLSGKFPKNGRVWQAPDNAAVFTTWCELTEGKGEAHSDGTVKPSSVQLGDGTDIRLRTASASGGYTIDINSPNHTKLYKVHVS